MIPCREMSLSMFSGPEWRSWYRQAQFRTTASRTICHGKAWQAVRLRRAIPYGRSFYQTLLTPKEDIAEADRLVASGELED